MIKIESTYMIIHDPLPDWLKQVEALLLNRLDGSRSPLEAALVRLIAAGGKRVRPRLALLTGSLLGSAPDPLLRLAAGVEMLHTASLIHDDLIDGAGLRRGVETLNAHWSAAASVLVGDFAFTHAAQLALETRCLPVIDLFTESMRRMVDGELTQLGRPHGLSNRDEYFEWIAAKTAALFELAVAAPALLAKADDGIVDAARSFGAAIGMAFQIMDDVLDFTGEADRLGKPAGQDLRQGVLTLPALMYWEAHPDDLGLDSLIQQQPLSGPDIERLLASIRASEAIEASVDVARGFISRGLEALDRLPGGPERLALAELTESIIKRQK